MTFEFAEERLMQLIEACENSRAAQRYRKDRQRVADQAMKYLKTTIARASLVPRFEDPALYHHLRNLANIAASCSGKMQCDPDAVEHWLLDRLHEIEDADPEGQDTVD